MGETNPIALRSSYGTETPNQLPANLRDGITNLPGYAGPADQLHHE